MNVIHEQIGRQPPGASLSDIEACYRAGYPKFLAVAAMLTGSAEDGHEAVQEGFARAIHARSTYRGDAPLQAWVWRVVVNTAQSIARRERPVLVRETPEVADRAEPPPSDTARLLSRLPARQRAVVFLRFYADMDYRTIAQVLEMEEGTVGSTLNAGLAALRRSLPGRSHHE